MQVFRVFVKDYDWDQYDSCIVVAESAERAIEMAKKCDIGKYTADCCFDENQGEVKAEPVNMSKEDIVCASFNAG